MQDARTTDAVSSSARCRNAHDSAMGPTISLVVPCYSTDRYEDVSRLIDSVQRQSPPIEELLIVVQQSRELESLLRKRLAALTSIEVHIIFLDIVPAVSKARNAGLREASSEVVAFADDDAVLADDWASATRRFYRTCPEAIGVAGAILPLWDSPAMEWFPRVLYWMLSCTYWTATSPIPVRNGYGANMSFRRQAFANGRQFNESIGISGWGVRGWRGMGGEEPELSLRVTAETGQPVMYVPDIRVWHRVRAHRLKPGSLLRRAYWEGRLKAALSGNATGTAAVLHTERSLLREIARAQIGRLRVLGSHPLVALRQQGVVLLVVAAVAFGFIEGKLRRNRAEGVSGASSANEEDTA